VTHALKVSAPDMHQAHIDYISMLKLLMIRPPTDLIYYMDELVSCMSRWVAPIVTVGANEDCRPILYAVPTTNVEALSQRPPQYNQ
jgi:hypothetical protein